MTPTSHALIQGPIEGTRMTDDYVRLIAQTAYLWSWPLVNLHNRLEVMAVIPSPGLIGGVFPAAPPGRLGMLHDYVRAEGRVVACPNQDVLYGFGMIDSRAEPSVIQVPDFGERFWLYQGVDQRTDSFVRLGTMYRTKPGAYLLAPSGWRGGIPEGIVGTFRFDTRVAAVIPRIYMADTGEDRVAIQPLINQVMMYPLSEFTGELRTADWASSPSFDGVLATQARQTPESPEVPETRWVDPEHFVSDLTLVMEEVPVRSGEEALYKWIRSVLIAAETDQRIADIIRETAGSTDRGMIAELFEFRNQGVSTAHSWTTARNGANFGFDYLNRTAIARSNIFVNPPTETTYFYQDLDSESRRLIGTNRYALRFERNDLPPVHGFWSLALYDEKHFFQPNSLDRYRLCSANDPLHFANDGSLTIVVGGPRPTGEDELANWLPAPEGNFSLYLRAYWPDVQILDGSWSPPAVTLVGAAGAAAVE
jgi:hypothetical protein